MAEESLNPGEETRSEHVRKGEACFLAEPAARQQCQTTGVSCHTQGQKGLMQCGLVAMSRALGPDSGFGSWLCHILAGWPWQVTSLVPQIYQSLLLHRVDIKIKYINACRVRSTELSKSSVIGL